MTSLRRLCNDAVVRARRQLSRPPAKIIVVGHTVLKVMKALPLRPAGALRSPALEVFDNEGLCPVRGGEGGNLGRKAACRIQAIAPDAPVQRHGVALTAAKPARLRLLLCQPFRQSVAPVVVPGEAKEPARDHIAG